MEAQLGEYAVFLENSEHRTAEVGRKEGNNFGVNDLSGNVIEWVEDCAHLTYDEAPSDGSAWLETDGGDCGRHMTRGGSWLYSAEYLRASYRSASYPNDRDNGVGFRLAQDIEP